jgi:hypothetical protein
MFRFILLTINLLLCYSYEVVMPTKNREKQNYLLQSLESFKNENIKLFRHGKNFDDYDIACLKSNVTCYTLDIDLDIKDDYLKWRTEQNIIVQTIMNDFLSRDNDYLVWVEDDVLLLNNLNFINDLKEDVICLRQGYKYCGATGYVLSRAFVRDLVEVIEKEKNDMPIDWILDKTIHNKNYFRKRKSVIKHIGLYSSRKDSIKREVD